MIVTYLGRSRFGAAAPARDSTCLDALGAAAGRRHERRPPSHSSPGGLAPGGAGRGGPMEIRSIVPPADEFPLPGVFRPPHDFVDERREDRLMRGMREAAQTRDPMQILTIAGKRF